MLSRFAAAVVAVNLCACVIEPVPIDAPARVVVTDSDVTDREIELIRRAADVWNAARPGAIVSVERGKPAPFGVCRVIEVSRLSPGEIEDCEDSDGCTFPDGCTADLRISAMPLDTDSERAYFASVAAHEMGHAFLGKGHSSDPKNIMYPASDTLNISDRQAKSVRYKN